MGRRVKRPVGTFLLTVALLTIPATNGPQTGAQRLPDASEHGCVLYAGVPNPCDPDTTN